MSAPGPSSPRDEAGDPDRVALVQLHLEKVLASKAFAGTKRSQDFLRLIIGHALAGRLDSLRERMIGAEMFGRPVDYDTANDAVVRVKANEVRRRLAQYYADEGTDSDAVWIELPTGSYVPEFHWESLQKPAEPPIPTEVPPPPAPSKHAARRRRVWLLGAVVAAVALAAVYWLAPIPSPAPRQSGALIRLTFDLGYTTDGEISPDGRLAAYSSDRGSGENLNIYVQDLKSGSLARFTDGPADDYAPAFSPDGTQIAFRSERNGGGIYQMSSLRGNAHLVVSGGRRPRFSPDGKYLLYWQSSGGFYSKWGGFGAHLFTVEVAGGSPVHITRNCGLVNTGAVWSPDSKRILFSGICQGQSGIWLASPDGKTLKSSSLYSFWTGNKLRSPDLGNAAVFDQWLDNPARLLMPLAPGDDISYEAILPVASDGMQPKGNSEPLVFGPSRITHASASQDGRVILSIEEQTSNIWTLKVDSSGRALGRPFPLKTGSVVNYEPALSKDGKNVVFIARESGAWELEEVNLADGASTSLSVRLPDIRQPVFNSKGDKVYYSGQLPGSGKNSDYELVLGSAVPRIIAENSFGGVWDVSPDDHWLIMHSRKPAPAPLGTSYDDNRPHRDALALVDRDTRQVTPFLSDPNANLYQAHFSHNGAGATFLEVRPQHSQIYIVPFSPREIPRTDWIAITDGSTWDDKPNFSSDDKLIFFVSDRDGFRCIWAQLLTSDMHPLGSPFAVYHFHSQRRSLSNLSIGRMSLAAGPGILVFNLGENTGNLWLRDSR